MPRKEEREQRIWSRDDSLSDEENNQRLAEFMQKMPRPQKPEYPDPMLPPWEMYPDYPRGSMGWRMGSGEDYMAVYRRWFAQLDNEEAEKYIASNAEPAGWEHFWVLMTDGIEAFRTAVAQT